MGRKKRKKVKDTREFADADELVHGLGQGTVLIAESWPDYTTDAGRAMPFELPPMPENMEERKNRLAWLALALGEAAKHAQGSDERARVRPIRRLLECKHCGGELENPRQQRGFCSDRCLLLDRYERRRAA